MKHDERNGGNNILISRKVRAEAWFIWCVEDKWSVLKHGAQRYLSTPEELIPLPPANTEGTRRDSLPVNKAALDMQILLMGFRCLIGCSP